MRKRKLRASDGSTVTEWLPETPEDRRFLEQMIVMGDIQTPKDWRPPIHGKRRKKERREQN